MAPKKSLKSIKNLPLVTVILVLMILAWLPYVQLRTLSVKNESGCTSAEASHSAGLNPVLFTISSSGVSLSEGFLNFGVLLSYVSNYGFAQLPKNLSWRLMLGVGAFLTVFLAVGALAMPESPRWLIMQGRLGDAGRVLNKTSDTKEEAECRLNEIKEAAGIPENCPEDVVDVRQRNSAGKGVWKELLWKPTTAVRRILIAGVGIHFFQQSTGIESVVLYSPHIFKKAAVTDF